MGGARCFIISDEEDDVTDEQENTGAPLMKTVTFGDERSPGNKTSPAGGYKIASQPHTEIY